MPPHGTGFNEHTPSVQRTLKQVGGVVEFAPALEAAMWRAAGLEEPNAKGAKGAEAEGDRAMRTQMPRWRWTISPQGASPAGMGVSRARGREDDGACIPCSRSSSAEGP